MSVKIVCSDYSAWREGMKYYLRNALLTTIWLICSFQLAQLWLDPNIMARSSLTELTLISIVMVGIAAALHYGAKHVLKI